MRCFTHTLISLALAAALGAPALAQRGAVGGYRGPNLAAPPSSAAIGAGATFGRAGFPSSTAIGAGAPARSLNRGTYAPVGGGYYSNRTSVRSRGTEGRRVGRRDYRNLPFAYFLTPYYYPFLDYGSAPYGTSAEDFGPEPGADSSSLIAENLLSEQIRRLTAEIAELKSTQQQSAMQPAAAPPIAPEPPAPVIPVTVVLRNGQKLQVQNYAVMDHTFWDFSRQPARKIPISSIDVSASSAATAASGGEFPRLASN